MPKNPPADPFKGQSKDDFKTWLKKKEVHSSTITALRNGGFETFGIFATINSSGIKQLDIKPGQRCLLESLAKEVQKMKEGKMRCPRRELKTKGKKQGLRRKEGSQVSIRCEGEEDPSKVEEANVKEEEVIVKVEHDTDNETSRDSAASRGKKRYTLEEEIARYKDKRQRQDEAGEETSGPASYNFGRKKERALDVGYMMAVFKEAPYSVGMIMHTDSHIGTGFRVGKHYLMTCRHVVFGGNGLKVKFNHISSMGSDEIIVIDIKEMVYHDDALDVAILKIDGADKLNSKPLQLCSNAVDGPVCFLGHPGFGNNTPMMLDTGIEMIHPDDIEKDSGKVIEYHETLLQRCNSHEDPHVVYRNCGMSFQRPTKVSWDGILDDNFRIIHTAFLPGASGSPGMQVDEAGQVRVRLMLCRGFPRFYHELTDEGRALHPMPSEKFRFEHGLDMNRLYLKMYQWVREVPSDSEFYASRQQLLDELFG